MSFDALPTIDETTIIWIAAIFATVVGFGFLAHSSYIAWAWPKAMGRVVGNRSDIAHRDSGESIVYFAEILFRAGDGRDYRVSGDVGRQQPWPLGTPIRLHYKAANPRHAMTMTLWQRLIFAGAFIGFATVIWGVIFGVIDR